MTYFFVISYRSVISLLSLSLYHSAVNVRECVSVVCLYVESAFMTERTHAHCVCDLRIEPKTFSELPFRRRGRRRRHRCCCCYWIVRRLAIRLCCINVRSQSSVVHGYVRVRLASMRIHTLIRE